MKLYFIVIKIINFYLFYWVHKINSESKFFNKFDGK